MTFLTRLYVTIALIFAVTYTCHGQVTVTSPSKTGPQQASVYATLDFITAHLDATCEASLPNIRPMIAALEGDRVNPDLILIGHGIFVGTLVAAFTGNGGNVPPGYLMVIADNGAFFTETVPDKHLTRVREAGTTTFGGPGGQFLEVGHKYKGGSNAAKVLISLHELSHAVGVAEPDFGDQAAIDRNDQRVMKSCSESIKAAGKIKGGL
jgi:hypothetical protein